MAFGSVTHLDDTATVRFELTIAVPISAVWRALTEELGDWLAPAELELAPGGSVHIDFGPEQKVDGRVTEVTVPRMLEYTWGFTGEHESAIRFELADAAAGTALVLEHRLLPLEQAIGYGAGWHAHLDALTSYLAHGAPIDWDARFNELYPLYAAR